MSKLKLNWVRKRKRSAEELPTRVPLHLGPFSNGEVFRPKTEAAARVERLIIEKADEGARRHNIDRREFLASTMGMATTMWALNLAGCSSSSSGGSNATGGGTSQGGGGSFGSGGTLGTGGVPMSGGAMPAGGMAASGGGTMSSTGGMGATGGQAATGGEGTGGVFNIPDDPTDMDAVCEAMLDPSKEFIFDIQSHHVNRADTAYQDFLRDQQQYSMYCQAMNYDELQCFGQNEYVRLMFLESDTSVAVLSGLPAATPTGNPITNAEIAQSRDAINLMADDSQRLVNHHMVLPNRTGTSAADVAAELDQMDLTLQMYGKIGAWKSYPAWSPENTESAAYDGFWFDDPNTGIPFIERGLQLGVPTFCIHKGLPIPGFSAEYNDPRDIGVVAKMFPEANFVVYHSGFGNVSGPLNFPDYQEGPYIDGDRGGVNSLITAVRDAGLGAGANVYAELGTTWQLLISQIPIDGGSAAAHVLGKLLLHMGEDNIVWGTDCIWYGSPQPLIETFLQFEIPATMQMQFGYPALTMERKRKILGLNAAKIYGVDPTAKRCAIQASDLQSARLYLDDAWGGRRWSMQKPALYSRRKFFELLRRDNMPG